MTRFLNITACTLANACGTGWTAVQRALRDGQSGLRPNDFEPARDLETWIGRVDGLESAALPPHLEAWDCRNNRLALLCLEQDGFVTAVQRARGRYGPERIAVYLGTSTSGILSTEQAWCTSSPLTQEDYQHRHSMYATTAFVRTYLGVTGPATTISTACSSSAKVFGAAKRAIDAGWCDAAIVGGVDSLALSTLYGFRALEVLSREPCRPFSADRNGISIGEAAGFALLEYDQPGEARVLGVGESSDAFHMSSPHPTGAGAAHAMTAALAAAGLTPEDIDYINLHGTGTLANDAAEDAAIMTVFGTATRGSSTKGYTGHALGAAGITEALLCVMALNEQWIPGTLNCRRVDSRLGSRIELESGPARVTHALTNSFGFGGTNCSVALGRGS